MAGDGWVKANPLGDTTTPDAAPTATPDAAPTTGGGGAWTKADPNAGPSGAGGPGTATGAFTRHFISNLPGGDDLSALAQSYYTGKSVAEQKRDILAQGARDWEEHPWAAGAGVGASYLGQAVALPVAGPEEALAQGITRAIPSAVKLAPLLSKAGVGAGYGALAGGTEGEDLWDTQGAAWGAGLGAIGGAAGHGLGSIAGAATGPVAEAANRLDVPMPRYQMGNPFMQRMGTISKSVPLFGDFTRSAEGKATSALAGNVQGAGAGVDAETAGGQIRDAINDWVQNASKRKVDRLYNNAASQLDQSKLTPLTNTNQLLRQMQSDLQQRGASLSGASIDEIAKANRRIANINNAFFAANPNAPASAAPGGLSYNAMKDLRTTIGQMKSTWGRINPDPIDAARVTRLHEALGKDLDAAAQNADMTGQGFAAHQNASRVFRTVQANRDALTPLIGAQGDKAPEQVFAGLLRKASATPSSADIDLLQRAKAAVQNSATPQAWDTFEQGVINQLGVGKNGFTPAMFLNQYKGIGNSAKNVLFSPQNRQMLEDARTVAQKMKDAGFAENPSGTSHGTWGALGLAALVEHGGAMLHHPIAATAGIGAGYGLGRFMLDPVTGTAGRNAGRLSRYLARGLPIAGGQLGAQYGSQP